MMMTMKAIVPTVAAWLFCLGMATAKEVTYEWNLEAIVNNDMSPDCMNIKDQRRFMYLANGQMPGPVIEAREGDVIRIKVTNMHPTESIGIHFHGIHQRGTPYMDGPAHVTQCGLGPHQTQEYFFEAYPPGTHYWHAHASLSLADGLSGPIIVHPKEHEPFEYDGEHTLFLQDWYIHTSAQQLVGLLNWPFTWIGNPNSLLINGKGIAQECLTGGANAENPLVCLIGTCTEDRLETFDVDAGKRYRLRIINSAQLVMMNIAIEGHPMIVVQVEGTNVGEVVTVDSLDLSPGQRYDVLIDANQTPGTYRITTTVRQRDIQTVLGIAFLHYTGSDNIVADNPDHPAWDDAEFGPEFDAKLSTRLPLQNPEKSYREYKALTAIKVTRYVMVGTQNQVIDDQGVPQRLVWGVNNMTNVMGKEPLIGSAWKAAQEDGWPSDVDNTILLPNEPPNAWDYTGKVDASEGGPGPKIDEEGRVIIRAERYEVIEIVLQNARALNGVAEFHPWHVHGHSMWEVGSGDGIWDESMVDSYNLVDPILRDTVTLWPLRWTAVRIYADNPGAWLFHCHITAHVEMGMGFTIVTSPDRLTEPSESVASCMDTSLFPPNGDKCKQKKRKEPKNRRLA